MISKSDKLVAIISLKQVGTTQYIGKMKDNLGEGYIFKVDIKNRVYILRAKSESNVNQWITSIETIMNDPLNNEEVNKIPSYINDGDLYFYCITYIRFCA